MAFERPCMKGPKVTTEERHKILFPLRASAKEDGIRCRIEGRRALTSSGKPLPNVYVRNYLEAEEVYDGMDGELVLRSSESFQDVQSAFMSYDGAPDFEFRVFDLCNRGKDSFEERYDCLIHIFGNEDLENRTRLSLLDQILCNNMEELEHAEDYFIAQLKKEGMMTRKCDMPYKFGDSSLAAKQQHLLKFKPLVETEAIVVGIVEGLTNTNEAELDEQGHTKRSDHQEGKVPNGRVGKFVVVNKQFGVHLVGGFEGMTIDERIRIFNIKEQWLKGMHILRYRYQEMGTAELPRQPIGMYFRAHEDMHPERLKELLDLYHNHYTNPYNERCALCGLTKSAHSAGDTLQALGRNQCPMHEGRMDWPSPPSYFKPSGDFTPVEYNTPSKVRR